MQKNDWFRLNDTIYRAIKLVMKEICNEFQDDCKQEIH